MADSIKPRAAAGGDTEAMAARRGGERAWDAFDVYLWDIDGTMLHCRDLVHYRAFNQALSSLAGRPLTIDGVTTHGNVDVGILRDAFEKHGVEESLWRPRRREILAEMAACVESRREEMRIAVLPQVRDALLHLKARGARLGVATGNLEAIGSVKLHGAGLLELFDFAAWSDAHETRAQVFAMAASMAREIAGPAASLCFVGDTPADVRAARSCGAAVIAVATGLHSMDELRKEEPDVLVQDLGELLKTTSR